MNEFHPPFRILLGPGPSDVHPRVLEVMSQSLLSHLDPVFVRIMDDVQEGLRSVFQTDSPMCIPISGTGTAGMETAMVNMIEPGDSVVVCSAGFFADRMAQIAKCARGDVRIIQADPGQVITPDQLKEAIQKHRPKIVAFVHVETSTGIAQPIEPLAELLRDDDIITIVDTVASLAGQPIHVTENALDFVYSGSQKCLSCPPGLAPVTLSENATARLASRKVPPQSWYFDLSLLVQYWGQERRYHHTAPISMIYALREALRVIEEEGLDNRYRRHHRNHLALVAGLEAMGLEMFVAPSLRSWTVNTVKVPPGIEDPAVRRALLERYGIEIVGGLGELKGKIWRIGLMGHSSQRKNVILLINALEEILRELGYGATPGSGAGAALRSYRETDAPL
jgi:alanine-glyoxylate transaminase/serine-glyoxylate transaminase/serine-pyruvate transaminase